mmetsp:Transcript_67/g.147  ORF Transcript_67/g.147 Transcript_67/m.147 type:complete len:116 (+) Transcript_67:842-1189(+)
MNFIFFSMVPSFKAMLVIDGASERWGILNVSRNPERALSLSFRGRTLVSGRARRPLLLKSAESSMSLENVGHGTTDTQPLRVPSLLAPDPKGTRAIATTRNILAEGEDNVGGAGI